jgi:serine/threonine protein kinase
MLDQGQKTATSPTQRGHDRLGRYELIARVGAGSLAEVHLARQVGGVGPQRGVVAVHRIHPHLARVKEFVDVLLDEARVSALIKHANVVDIYDLGVSRGVYFIAMEYLAGQPLQAVLARANVDTAPDRLDVLSIARLIADVASGLRAAHEQRSLSGRALDLVHRDVSPRNIVVLYDGGVKLVDFGMARARAIAPAEGGKWQDASRLGRVGYAAPEVITGSAADRRADVFSLGVVMWEALARRRLYDAKTDTGALVQIKQGTPQPPSVHRPEVPRELDRICLRALAADPIARFQTAGELQAALEGFLSDSGFEGEDAALARFISRSFAAERDAQEALVRRVNEHEVAAERAPVKAPARRDERVEGETGVDTFVESKPDFAPVAQGSQRRPLTRDATDPAASAPAPVEAAPPAPSPAAPAPAAPTPAAPAPAAPAPAAPAAAKVPEPARPRAVTVPGPKETARPTAIVPRPLSRPARKSGPVRPAVFARAGSPPAVPAPADAEGAERAADGSRPRGKGRTGRIESPTDAWSDRRNQAGRTLPLPAPPRAAKQGAAPVEPAVADADEDEDDFTVVEPDKSPRSFEPVRPGRRTSTPIVMAEGTTPILAPTGSRGIWVVVLIALAVTALVGALVFAALGGTSDGRDSESSDEPLAGAEAAAERAAASTRAAEIPVPTPIAAVRATAGNAAGSSAAGSSAAGSSAAGSTAIGSPATGASAPTQGSGTPRPAPASGSAAPAERRGARPSTPADPALAGSTASGSTAPGSASGSTASGSAAPGTARAGTPPTIDETASPGAAGSIDSASPPAAPRSAEAPSTRIGSASPAAPRSAESSASGSARPGEAPAEAAGSPRASAGSDPPAGPSTAAGSSRASAGAAPGAGASAPGASAGAAPGAGTEAPGAGAAPADDASARGGSDSTSARRRRAEPARKPAARPQPSPDALYRDGARLYLAGDLDQARRVFQSAIEASPRFAPAHRGLGLVHERAGQKALAVRSLETYLRLSPGAPDAAAIRARIERLSR